MKWWGASLGAKAFQLSVPASDFIVVGSCMLY
jgi:hypothetical protein